MPKFLFIFRQSTDPQSRPSPEEMQVLAGQWYAWMQKFSASILPGGDGLKPSGRLIKAGIVTDGPYVEAKEFVASFSLIQADNYDAAVAIARECPGEPRDRDPRIGRLRMNEPRALVEHFFRHEFGRLVAVLTRSLGVRRLDLVEDVVQSRARAGPGNVVAARRSRRPGRLALPHRPQPRDRRLAAGANPRQGVAAPGR